jgi:hypothetical protein
VSDPTLQHAIFAANSATNLGILDAYLNNAAAFSMFLTIYRTGATGNIFAIYDAGSGNFIVLDVGINNAGNVQLWIRNSPPEVYSYFPTTQMPLNAWCSYAFVYDGSLSAANRIKQYVNGAPMTCTSTDNQPAVFPAFANGYSTTLGTGSFGASLAMKMGPMAFFNKALSQDEITAYHNNLATTADYFTVSDIESSGGNGGLLGDLAGAFAAAALAGAANKTRKWWGRAFR